MKRKTTTSLFLAVSLAVVSLAGCGQSGKTENPDTQTAESSSQVSETSGSAATVVNIGTMDLVNGDLIAQYEKYYENELGVEVNLVKFDSGKDVNTALASGSIDISELGSSPSALGIATDVDYQVFWIGDIIGEAESLVVRNGSGIEAVADLVGKKVATPFASTAHYSLENALQLAGVSENDVEILDLQPDDIYAAWTRGDIDAAYVWYPVLSQLLEDGYTITDSAKLAGEGIITADLNVVRTAFAEENPDIVTKYVQAQIKANDLILNDRDTAVSEVAGQLEISEEDAASQLEQFVYLTAEEQLDYLNNQIAETLKKTADFLVEQDSIKEAPDLEVYEEHINTSFIEAAIQQ